MDSLSRGKKIVQLALNSMQQMQENATNTTDNMTTPMEVFESSSSLVQNLNNLPVTTSEPEVCNFDIPRSPTDDVVQELNNSHSNMDESKVRDVYTVSCDSKCPTVMSLSKIKTKNYYISPVHTDESDIDDSDADPNFSSDSSSVPSSSSEGSLSSSVNEAKTKKGRKRERKPESWVNQKAKLLRNSGKAYVSSSKSKKKIPERKVRPPCGEKCRLGCSRKISDAAREEIFVSYWNLGDLQRQREFIVSHTELIKKKYRYSSTENFRNLNSAFYFEKKATRIRVCKAFFKATLDINDRPIRTALFKKSDTGFLQCEMRGKHGKQPTVDPEIKDSVRNFINAIPRIESHYLRAQTTREYIENSKSLADLFRDYKDDREKQDLPFANASMFNRIFRGEFNISFYIPKKDQCDLCESFKNTDEEGKKSLLEAYNMHQKEKELSRKEKDNDKKDPNGAYVAVYDLQAVMPLPRGFVSSFFYKSKMNCFNFTISDLHAKNVECYFWNETEGKRGAVEIGSCVLHYINMLLENTNNTDVDVVFFSDNCFGQQKNKYLLSAYSYAVNKLSKLRSITHKFLICGHSQNEGDNVHSVIEKQVKRHLKSCPIYIPQQYATLIRAAKKNGPPYRVHEFTHENFFDLNMLQEQWGNNFTVDTERIQVKWHDIKVLRVEKEHPYSFFCKTSYEDVMYRKVNVRNVRKRNSSEVLTDSLQLVNAYSKKLPLADNKKKDIQELFNKNIIPKSYYDSFFKNVLESC